MNVSAGSTESRMATDVGLIIENLRGFYDFDHKTVIAVGAGGGRFVEFARSTRKVVAVNIDQEALDTLKRSADERAMTDLFEFALCDFLEYETRADVILFEFSLHEMTASGRALQHARGLARDVVVLDHLPNSEWMFYANEEAGVLSGAAAMKETGIRQQAEFDAEQYFERYEDLKVSFSQQGPVAFERIAIFKDSTNIRIRMPYGASLL